MMPGVGRLGERVVRRRSHGCSPLRGETGRSVLGVGASSLIIYGAQPGGCSDRGIAVMIFDDRIREEKRPRPVGTGECRGTGKVEWMWGPGACPGGGRYVGFKEPARLAEERGQAPGPHPSPHLPPVPTGRERTFSVIPSFGWQSSSGVLKWPTCKRDWP